MKIKPFVFGFVALLAIPFVWHAWMSGSHVHKYKVVSDGSSIVAEMHAAKEGEKKAEPQVAENPDMLQRVAQVIEDEVGELSDEYAVNNYLSMLKERSLAQKQVTALEVEPGVQAIMNLEPTLGHEEIMNRISEYEREMEKLSKDLREEPEQVPPAATEDMETMLDDIYNAKNEKDKQATIRRFLDASDSIEDMEEQQRLIQRLDEIVAVEKEEQPAPDFNELEYAISGAQNEELKQAAIRRYLDAVDRLSIEEQGEVVSRLDTLIKQ